MACIAQHHQHFNILSQQVFFEILTYEFASTRVGSEWKRAKRWLISLTESWCGGQTRLWMSTVQYVICTYINYYIRAKLISNIKILCQVKVIARVYYWETEGKRIGNKSNFYLLPDCQDILTSSLVNTRGKNVICRQVFCVVLAYEFLNTGEEDSHNINVICFFGNVQHIVFDTSGDIYHIVAFYVMSWHFRLHQRTQFAYWSFNTVFLLCKQEVCYSVW